MAVDQIKRLDETRRPIGLALTLSDTVLHTMTQEHIGRLGARSALSALK